MSDPGLYERIALRRVHDGGVAKVAGVYLDRGRPTPDYLTAVFDLLTWTGWATVAGGDPIWHVRRLILTDAGAARYAELCGQHRTELPVPDPVFGTQRPPTDRRSSDTPQVTEHRAAPAGRSGSTP